MYSAVGYQPTLAEMGELQDVLLPPRKALLLRTGGLRPTDDLAALLMLQPLREMQLPFFLMLLPSLVFTQQLILWRSVCS